MPRRYRSSGVRGPNSALTEFLRNEGITENFRRRRDQEENERELQQQSEADGTLTENTPEIEEIATSSPSPARSRSRSARPASRLAEEDDEESQIRAAGRRKRRAARRNRGGPGDDPGDSDSDDKFSVSDDDGNFSGSDDLGASYKKFGEEDTCSECGNPFTVTVYSRYVEDLDGYLCDECNEKLKKRERNARRNELNARKKRKKLAQALLDKSTVRIPSLQDICIKEITSHIDDVEALGDIGQSNINKISKILSKNRSLNDSTISLFLNPDLKSLEFWDCSNVSSHSLNQIAAFCSQLESLTLFMCGQFHNDNLVYYKDKLHKLQKLSLNGPFLISNTAWQDFFEQSESEITQFEVRNTHRFGNDAFITFMEKKGPKLTLLKLLRLDGLDSAAIYELLPHYISPSTMTELEISYPASPEIITDELMIHILAITGETMVSLNVDGCSALTDEFIKEGISKFCPRLEHLSMKGLNLLTNDGFITGFDEFKMINTSGLVTVDLTKCSGLGDQAIYRLLLHSGGTLIDLSLNSLYLLSKSFLSQILMNDESSEKKAIKKAIDEGVNNEVENDEEVQHYYKYIDLPLLTRLDVGFVRCFDDDLARQFSEKCPKLRILEVFGDNRCTVKVHVRPDLLIIGRQGDLA